MSTYGKLGMRLIVLFILIVGVMALAKPQQAFALTCQEQCIQFKVACLNQCDGDFSCIPDCVDSFNLCLAHC